MKFRRRACAPPRRRGVVSELRLRARNWQRRASRRSPPLLRRRRRCIAAGRPLVDNARPQWPRTEIVAMPTRRELANAIRALSMDAVQQRQFGPPRHAHGHGRHRRGAVARLPEAQPGQSALVGPRPLRAVQRPRLDAAVFAAAPDRLSAQHRGASRTSASSAAARPGIPSTTSTLGIETTTGPLGQGLANARRHGARREAAGARSSTAPACRSSITTPMCSAATAA